MPECKSPNSVGISACLKIGLVSCRGFTLSEILVVITIVILSVALLLPVLKLVQATALSLRCQSNLRQIGMGIHTFAIENDDRLPQLNSPGGGGPYMYSRICEYLDEGNGFTVTAKLLQCPGETVHYLDARGDYGPNGHYVSVSGVPPYLGYPWSAVKKQSSTFLMVDARNSGGGFWNLHMGRMRQWGIVKSRDAHGTPWPPRHGKGMNWLFFDLHITRLSTEQVLAMGPAGWWTLTGYPVP